jgi:hypothetical protein
MRSVIDGISGPLLAWFQSNTLRSKTKEINSLEMIYNKSKGMDCFHINGESCINILFCLNSHGDITRLRQES